MGQRRLSSQRSIKGAEEETQELINKPSTIPSEEVQDNSLFCSGFILNISPLNRRTLICTMFHQLMLRMRHHLSF